MDECIDRAAKIARANDRFRGMALDVTLSQGVIRTMRNPVGLMMAVEQFNSFDETNDPYSEHDFGALMWEGNRVFWKIDYYDRERKNGSDPLEPGCRRVMTIMLASEY